MFRSIIFLSVVLLGCSDASSGHTVAPPSQEVVAAHPPQKEPLAQSAAPPLWGYEVVARYPHGTQYFTQGLFIQDGVLYESTGKRGESALIRHGFLGEAEHAEIELPAHIFGEGAVAVGDRIISLTWRAGVGYIHRLSDFQRLGEFELNGEGWGLTYDGDRLIVSDGTDRLRFLDPDSFEETGSVSVRLGDRIITQLNELEYIDGEVWANIWQTDVIARIDPKTGQVNGLINLEGLYTDNLSPYDNVLNGIAFDPESRRLFVTGKRWPDIYEIRVPLPSP